MINNIPTFSNGIALTSGESRYPYLWKSLVGMWCPSVGKQGDTLFDLSLYNRTGILNNFISVDITPLGIPSARSQFNAGHAPSFAVDDNFSTQWAGNASGFPYWWKMDFGSGSEKVIITYTLRARNDGGWEEIPEDWTLEGSNNDSDWDILDTQNAIVWIQSEIKTFQIPNSTAYRYYRINISDNQGTNINGSFAEIEFFEQLNIYKASINGYNIEYNGIDQFLDIGNIPEINDASQDLSFIIKLKTSINQTNNAIFYYDDNNSLSGSSDFYCMFKTNLTIGGFGDSGEWNTGFPSSNLQDGNLHTLALILKGVNKFVYVDGQLVASLATDHNHSNYSTSHNLRLADNANVGHYNGELGNFLVYNRALEPSEIIDLHVNKSPLTTFIILGANGGIASQEETETLQISDSIIVTDTIAKEAENLLITDSIIVQDTTIQQADSLQISDSIIVTDTNIDAKFISKIISINPLIFITDTNPVEIIKVDTTDPSNITWIVQTISGITSAKDVSVNTSNNFIYIAGNTGQVIKVEIADLTNQTIIDVSDVDDLITIETNSNFGITYAGTENDVGELYVIDERDTFTIDSDFQVIAPIEFLMDSDFNIIDTFKMNSDFRVLAQQTFLISSDFKCITKPIVAPPPTVNPLDVIEPIKLTDFQVFINGIELEDTDLVLDSISITHSQSEQSSAFFRLTRKHDQLNTTLKGISSQITNQNTVEIKIRGITEFNGHISELDCQYNNEEFIIVNCLSPEKSNQSNNITLSLPSLDSRLSLYDILIENPKIFNPFIDEDDDNPKKFKGIKVNLGKLITQQVTKFTIGDANGNIASEIQDGTFIPFQNWTYFWGTIIATNFGEVKLGDTSSQTFFYIGTSLAPVSEELWDLTLAEHHRQRIYSDEIIELGEFTIGEAPFQDISVRNGIFVTKPKLVDESDRLSNIKEAGNNFIKFAKEVARLEFEKLKNINGNILPDTSCIFNLTVDAYYYYDISLLTKINIDNTTDANIYNNANGFPVSAKSITITSADRRVTINADNIKSTKELEEINGKFPSEDDDEFNEKERRILIAVKSNMKTGLRVE